MKNKMSSEQVGQILGQVPTTLRAQQQKIASLREENADLKEKVAHYERKVRVEKIASVMEEKGLDPETTLEDKVSNLMSSETDLDIVEKAIQLSAPQVKLASISDNPGNASDAKSAFEMAIME
jgi:hypothetical protein